MLRMSWVDIYYGVFYQSSMMNLMSFDQPAEHLHIAICYVYNIDS